MTQVPARGSLPIEIKLLEEAAHTLAAVGRELEATLARLAALREEYPSLSPEERPARAAEYRQLRREAEYRLWCLVVQREALGIRLNEEVYRLYPLPPARLE